MTAIIAAPLAIHLTGCSDTRERWRPGPSALAALEARADGRLGVSAIDTANGRRLGWRDNEFFAQCSSFKLSLAAMVLEGAERGLWSAQERLTWTAGDILAHSPVTSLHVAGGLTMAELAEAALVTSDNAAANVLLRRLGGPPALTAFWRRIGDPVSRLDRFEPDLNLVLPGSPLDSTTPAAMAATVQRLLFGTVLRAEGRALLGDWMGKVETGLHRLRAGFPTGWTAGDKTGTGINPVASTYIDLAFGAPPERAPLVIAAYFSPRRPGDAVDPAAEAVLAQVGRLCAAMILP